MKTQNVRSENSSDTQVNNAVKNENIGTAMTKLRSKKNTLTKIPSIRAPG